MTRIAYVCADPGVPVFGRKGCSVHVQEVVRALLAWGARVELFVARTGGEAPADLAAVPVHLLPPVPSGDLATREAAALAGNEHLRAALVAAGDFDLVYERYSLWAHAAMEYARACGVPGLLEVNAPLVKEQATHRGLVDVRGAEASTARAFGAASAVLAVSDEVAAFVRDSGVERGRVVVVPNGVDVERFKRRGGGVRPGGVVTVGFVGTLKPWHGLEVLVKAFSQAALKEPGLRLLIVGDGPQRESIERAVVELGMASKVTFTGLVAPEGIPGLMESMDIAVAPYPMLSGFYFSPLKVFEYMAAGLPVVASRIGQLQRILTHGRTGLLVPPGDAVQLAGALLSLARSPAECERLGEAARLEVGRNHTWKAVAGRILEIGGVVGLEGAFPAPARKGGV